MLAIRFDTGRLFLGLLPLTNDFRHGLIPLSGITTAQGKSARQRRTEKSCRMIFLIALLLFRLNLYRN